MSAIVRCGWVTQDSVYEQYHDNEWGVPVRDDRKQFEFLILESAQAGLSWLTILKRREAYRKAFADYDPNIVARFDESKTERLMRNSGIIRNKLKIRAAIKNAQVLLAIQKEFGSFSTYLWRFVDDSPIINHWKHISEVPATADVSDRVSADLKKRGMSFVGSTIIYAHLQATGLVNDHVVSCFRYSQLGGDEVTQ